MYFCLVFCLLSGAVDLFSIAVILQCHNALLLVLFILADLPAECDQLIVSLHVDDLCSCGT